MTQNLGTIDRALRAVIGLTLLVLAYATLAAPWNAVAAVVGAVLLATAAMRFCPLYRLVGLRTCRVA